MPTVRRIDRPPASVFAAVVALGLLQGLDLIALWGNATSSPALLSLALRLVLVLGLLLRKRFAWYLVRYMGLAVAVLNPLLQISRVFPDEGFAVGATLHVVAASGLLVAASWALSRSSAILYFGLVCPQCKRTAARWSEFATRGASCRGCTYVWPAPETMYRSA